MKNNNYNCKHNNTTQQTKNSKDQQKKKILKKHKTFKTKKILFIQLYKKCWGSTQQKRLKDNKTIKDNIKEKIW